MRFPRIHALLAAIAAATVSASASADTRTYRTATLNSCPSRSSAATASCPTGIARNAPGAPTPSCQPRAQTYQDGRHSPGTAAAPAVAPFPRPPRWGVV